MLAFLYLTVQLAAAEKKSMLLFGSSSRACVTLSWTLIPCLHGTLSVVHDKQVISIESCLTQDTGWNVLSAGRRSKHTHVTL